MHIVCLVKFVPNIDNFQYDYENNVLIRENVHMILNPDDAAALAYALKQKEKQPEVTVEVVTMAPLSILNHVRDLLRISVDKATVISDQMFVGSDTYATSKIIVKYLQSISFDLICTGSHSLDGDTAHIPSQIAELLKLEQVSGIKTMHELDWEQKTARFDVELERMIYQFQVELPAILSIVKESGYKLPYVRYNDLNMDVDEKLKILTNADLGFTKEEVGLAGSLTKVLKTQTKQLQKKENIVVQNDAEGVEAVYQFLKAKGYV